MSTATNSQVERRHSISNFHVTRTRPLYFATKTQPDRDGAMPIVEEYDAIARRLRELRSASPKSVDEITDLEQWRDLARQTAREYVEDRRRSALNKRILPRRLQA